MLVQATINPGQRIMYDTTGLVGGWRSVEVEGGSSCNLRTLWEILIKYSIEYMLGNMYSNPLFVGVAVCVADRVGFGIDADPLCAP